MLEKVPHVHARNLHRGNLLVTRPSANPVYDTTQMAYAPRQWEIGYFTKNRWAAKPADLLQDLLMQSLQTSRGFRTVTLNRMAGQPDLILNSEILRFREDLTGHRPVFQVTLRVELVKGATGKTLVIRDFKASQPLSSQSPYAMVQAANQAVASVLRQVTVFCLKYNTVWQDE